MAAPQVSMRCPTCGAELRIVLAPEPPTQWFPCPHCRNPVPVVVPRDPPPLYSWEVLSGLYPALPPPRRPRVRVRRMAEVALVIVTALAIGLAGVYAVLGWEALGPASYAVSGTVFEQTGSREVAAVGATVTLTVNGGASTSVPTDGNGRFAFSNVGAGGIALNVTAPGFAPANIQTFASPVYGTETTGLTVVLVHGSASNATTVTLSPFPDLETFVASIGSGVALLGIVALLGGWAAVVTARSNRPAVGVVGGAGGLLAPVALYFLSLGGIFPYLLAVTTTLAAAGAFAATTRSLEIYQVGPESPPA
ncbi:MAG TPA: carboxypeptidase-like regulatory domain-containing protein [Thermoplasmata archaeon]|nr:carboxypeptidase-like regulatory domain-containing protein [Thermoplasmata archaeon]